MMPFGWEIGKQTNLHDPLYEIDVVNMWTETDFATRNELEAIKMGHGHEEVVDITKCLCFITIGTGVDEIVCAVVRHVQPQETTESSLYEYFSIEPYYYARSQREVPDIVIPKSKNSSVDRHTRLKNVIQIHKTETEPEFSFISPLNRENLGDVLELIGPVLKEELQHDIWQE